MKAFAYCILFFLPGLFLHAQPASTEPEGEGSVSHPYQIATLENLLWISENSEHWDKNYIQTADIDASETADWNGGEGWMPIGNTSIYFAGTYDGQGHVISGLTINRPGSSYNGLFGYVYSFEGDPDTVISNLGLVDVNITGGQYTGGLSGWVEGQHETAAKILQCFVTGNISGTGSTGGLVGYMAHQSYLENSFTRCHSISGGWGTGGIAGSQWGSLGQIVNSYAASFIGGSGGGRGGLVGNGNNSVTDSFWDTEVSGITTSAGGTGKTTAEMKTQSTFTDAGWDFDEVWAMDPSINQGYPYLKDNPPPPDLITWKGSESNDWDDPSNWNPQRVPAPGDNVLIPDGTPNDPVIGTGVHANCNKITLKDGANLTIESTQNGTGSLIHNSTEVQVQATVQQYIPASTGNWDKNQIQPDNWYWIAPPASGQEIDNFLGTLGESDFDLYRWDEASDTWLNFKHVGGGFNHTSFQQGVGYLFAAPVTATFSYQGGLFAGDQEWKDLSRAGEGSENLPPPYEDYTYQPGWHLLGNPYTSGILVNGWDIEGLVETPKLWRHGSYVDLIPGEDIYEETGFIPSMTAFFMQVLDGHDGDNSLMIPASARAHEAQGNGEKTTTSTLIRLVAKAQESTMRQESIIRLEPEAKEGFDPRFDSHFMPGNAPEFFSLTPTNLLSTQSINHIDHNLVIPFGFRKNNEGNNFEITLETTIEEATLYLIDLQLDIEHKLNLDSPYEFTAFPGDDPNRFELRFGSIDETGIEEAQMQKPRAWVYNNVLYVESHEESARVTLFDISGRTLRTFFAGTGQQAYPLNLPTGLYMVRISGSYAVETIKIVVQ